MRLIDADKLTAQFTEVMERAEEVARRDAGVDIETWKMALTAIAVLASRLSDIHDAPTVDAIPVSFLEGLRDNARSVEASDRIQEIIDLWDKELKGWN